MTPEPDPPVRLSLLRCDRCRRAIPVTPAEVRSCAQGPWPACCGADLVLYIAAERPERYATGVTAAPLALPGANAEAGTAVLAPPPARKAVAPS